LFAKKVVALRFYTDVHIAREAVSQLRQKGVDILHCGDIGMADAADEDHLIYATSQERILVSCDDDFLRLHETWQRAGRKHAGIVYFRMVDQCKSVSIIVREVLFLHEAADYGVDLYNHVWRART
jgi:predicted nuclease of predicted toxin-antitoxin system